jgi:hypothetical protein
VASSPAAFTRPLVLCRDCPQDSLKFVCWGTHRPSRCLPHHKAPLARPHELGDDAAEVAEPRIWLQPLAHRLTVSCACFNIVLQESERDDGKGLNGVRHGCAMRVARLCGNPPWRAAGGDCYAVFHRNMFESGFHSRDAIVTVAGRVVVKAVSAFRIAGTELRADPFRHSHATHTGLAISVRPARISEIPPRVLPACCEEVPSDGRQGPERCHRGSPRQRAQRGPICD